VAFDPNSGPHKIADKILGRSELFLQVPPPRNLPIMVSLRLTRKGSKDRPYYKIIAIDSRKRRDGRCIEQLGTYDPMQEGVNYVLDLDKTDRWLSTGAKASETVASIIKKARSGNAPRTKAAKPAPQAPKAAPPVEAPKAEAPKAEEAPATEEPKTEGGAS
jgi:small subunit ribosomal protein S16